MKSIIVFYEDQRGQPRAEFTLHEFVVACVRSRLPADLQRDLGRRLRAVTPKGVNEVLKRFADLEAGRGEHRVALVDRDRVAEHLPARLPRDACRQQIFEGILGVKKPELERQIVVLLESNLEDFLRHIGASAQFAAGLRAQLDLALAKGRGAMQARDLVLKEARSNVALREDAAQFPSIARLITRLVALILQG